MSTSNMICNVTCKMWSIVQNFLILEMCAREVKVIKSQGESFASTETKSHGPCLRHFFQNGETYYEEKVSLATEVSLGQTTGSNVCYH